MVHHDGSCLRSLVTPVLCTCARVCVCVCVCVGCVYDHLAGSWEHSAGKVFWDAHYQHALLLLSSALAHGDEPTGGIDPVRSRLLSCHRRSRCCSYTLSCVATID